MSEERPVISEEPNSKTERRRTESEREVLKPEERRMKLERCLKNREASLVVFGWLAGRRWPRS